MNLFFEMGGEIKMFHAKPNFIGQLAVGEIPKRVIQRKKIRPKNVETKVECGKWYKNVALNIKIVIVMPFWVLNMCISEYKSYQMKQ